MKIFVPLSRNVEFSYADKVEGQHTHNLTHNQHSYPHHSREHTEGFVKNRARTGPLPQAAYVYIWAVDTTSWEEKSKRLLPDYHTFDKHKSQLLLHQLHYHRLPDNHKVYLQERMICPTLTKKVTLHTRMLFKRLNN